MLDEYAFNAVYSDHTDEIARRVTLLSQPLTQKTMHDRPEWLRNVEVIFSGWGCPTMDRSFLDAAPKLKAIFYAAGAISGWATPALWERNIVLTTANHANAIPVAEYTLAAILFSLKLGWRLANRQHLARAFEVRPEVPGVCGSVVGLIGMGTVARLLVKLLALHDLHVIAYDPFMSADVAHSLGIDQVAIDELFAVSDVVSLHTSDLPATNGLVTGNHLSSMKHNATFINTSRGRVVCEQEMIDTLRSRPDLQAVLDVTVHEPLSLSSPLRYLPNVVFTPHIAGSQGRECKRLGQYMVEELDRYLAGRPLLWRVRGTELEHSVNQLTADVP